MLVRVYPAQTGIHCRALLSLQPAHAAPPSHCPVTSHAPRNAGDSVAVLLLNAPSAALADARRCTTAATPTSPARAAMRQCHAVARRCMCAIAHASMACPAWPLRSRDVQPNVAAAR